MIDLHTHIIPEFDDGSKSVEMSFEMLCGLKAVGFDNIVLTSHFYPNMRSLADFVSAREKAYHKLRMFLDNRKETFNLFLGSEVYLAQQIFNYSDISSLCINNSRYILVELPQTSYFSDETFEFVNKLINDYGVIPVLAHIDRYDFLMNEKNLARFIELGCHAQINLSSLLRFKKKKRLLKFIKDGYISAIGTDSHRAPIKTKEIKKALALIEKKLGSEALSEITEESSKILGITS